MPYIYTINGPLKLLLLVLRGLLRLSVVVCKNGIDKLASHIYIYFLQQLELYMKQWTGSKLGKEYVKAVYCYPAHLTSI